MNVELRQRRSGGGCDSLNEWSMSGENQGTPESPLTTSHVQLPCQNCQMQWRSAHGIISVHNRYFAVPFDSIDSRLADPYQVKPLLRAPGILIILIIGPKPEGVQLQVFERQGGNTPAEKHWIGLESGEMRLFSGIVLNYAVLPPRANWSG